MSADARPMQPVFSKSKQGRQQVNLSPPAVLHAGWLRQGCLGWGQHTRAAHHGTAGTGARQSHRCMSTSGRLWTGGAPRPAHTAAHRSDSRGRRVSQDSIAQAHECVWRLHRRSSLAAIGGCLGAMHATVPGALSAPCLIIEEVDPPKHDQHGYSQVQQQCVCVCGRRGQCMSSLHFHCSNPASLKWLSPTYC